MDPPKSRMRSPSRVSSASSEASASPSYTTARPAPLLRSLQPIYATLSRFVTLVIGRAKEEGGQGVNSLPT